jgi:hypothetical protein
LGFSFGGSDIKNIIWKLGNMIALDTSHCHLSGRFSTKPSALATSFWNKLSAIFFYPIIKEIFVTFLFYHIIME